MFRFRGHGFEFHHSQIAAITEIAGFIQHKGDAAGHAGGEISSGLPQHHHGTAGHVFTAVVTHTFDHGKGTGITHGETFAGDTSEITFAADRTIQHGVTDNNVFFRLEA